MRRDKSEELLRLEDLIANHEKSDIVRSALNLYRECEIDDQFFISLAAPSMTGKTQLAFSAESKLPLYFVFDSSQNIYKNFHNLSDDFLYAAKQDYGDFEMKLVKLNWIEGEHEPFSLRLLQKVRDFKFRTLGILFQIMDGFDDQIVSSKFNISSWMEYLSNKRINSKEPINPISMVEFCQHSRAQFMLKNFYLFMDEFSATPELVVVRNLCRGIGLTCLLASTNAKVMNLIGKSRRSSSRTELPGVWSVVVPKLPPVPTKIIENFGLEEKLEKIIKRTCSEDEERTIKLVEYIKDQCFVSRPGVSKYILESIDHIVSVNIEPLTADVFFTTLLKRVTLQIRKRKANAFASAEGINSNVKLLNGDLFDSNYLDEFRAASSSKMIDNHFFHLKNPNNEDSKPFLLFRDLSNSKPLILRNWVPQDEYLFQCYFDLKEEILLLSCLMASIGSSTTKVFFASDEKESAGNGKNITSLSYSGNLLEVITLSAVIDSSHYSNDEIDGSFTGVPLGNFFGNFIRNLDWKCEKFRSKSDIIDLKCGKELEDVMKSFKVPFLFPANNKWPKHYEELFPPTLSSFRLGTYYRTSNQDQIDAHFDLLGRNDEKLQSVVECKNRKKSLYINDHLSILKKAQKFFEKEKIFLHLTICRSCADFDDARKSGVITFMDYTESELINVYRLKATRKRNEFKLVPAVTRSKLHSNPKLISIIFETEIIDEAFKKAL